VITETVTDHRTRRQQPRNEKYAPKAFTPHA